MCLLYSKGRKRPVMIQDKVEKLFLKDKIPRDKFSGFTKSESGLRILFKLR